jgi:flagellar biosynthesis regulator FlaF
MKKKLRSLSTTTNLWDWVINDVFFEDMQNAKFLRALLITTNLWD